MREHYTLPRLYINGPQHLEFSLTQELELDKAQAHYLGTVLRKSLGDSVRVFNGKDGEWRADITQISRKGARLLITKHLRPQQNSPDIWLCFAPVRKHRNAFIFEKATELGAAAFQPVMTARTQFPKMNVAKAAAQITEAAEQTERLDIPQTFAAKPLAELIGGWDPSRHLIFADEAGGVAATDKIAALRAPAAILIGPEGGFTPEERALLTAQDFVSPVSLGPRILRADTAALSLLSLWQAHCGDW